MARGETKNGDDKNEHCQSNASTGADTVVPLRSERESEAYSAKGLLYLVRTYCGLVSTRTLSLTFFLSTVSISLLYRQPRTYRISRPHIFNDCHWTHTMSPDIDLEVGQVPQATPPVRAFVSLSHHIPFG